MNEISGPFETQGIQITAIFVFHNFKGSGKVQRSFESSLKHEQYASGDLPHEWEGLISLDLLYCLYRDLTMSQNRTWYKADILRSFEWIE